MSDILLPATLDSLRERERTLEFDACAVKARIEEVRELIALLEQGPRRRPGRPKRLAIMEMPQRVAGGEHQPETDTEETAA